jgi:membrane protease subunit HflK
MNAVHNNRVPPFTVPPRLAWLLPYWNLFWKLALVGGLAAYFLSGLYMVKTDEQGVVRRFGRVVANNISPGVHYRWPTPFEQVDTPKTTEIKRMSVGFLFTESGRGGPAKTSQAEMLTGDTNIINVQMMIQYTIKDPSEYLFYTYKPDFLVRKTAESVLTHLLGGMSVDEVLTIGKVEIQERTKQETQRLLDQYHTGIHIVATNLQAVEPPASVIDAFNDVSSAKIDRQRLINEAEGARNERLPKARGQARKVLEEAEGYRLEKINQAKGESEKFIRILEEYEKAQGITEIRLYLETMEKILPGMQKLIVDVDKENVPVDLRILTTE